ncbi:hypothetical protein V6Z11_A08G231700 [Gossypium hirsutum]
MKARRLLLGLVKLRVVKMVIPKSNWWKNISEL